MVHHEAFLPASRGREFQARLYYNREDTALRLEHAKHLLLSTDRKILDIALECGFQNSVNFNKCFRNHTGTTPSEYRENNRTSEQTL